MYFITPSDPNIFLIGVDDTQLYGIGEKNNKLCIYHRSMFDIGNWQEYYLIDIKPVKCRSCKNGIHVATRLFDGIDVKLVTGILKKSIWIAARENQYTHVFSIDIGTKKFTRYKMLEEIYSEFALLDLSLCCKCLAPVILMKTSIANCISLVIAPRQYKSEVGIYRIRVTINKSNHCLLWKKNDSFFLHPRSSTNILINYIGEVRSIIGKSKEDGRIEKLALKFEDQQSIEYLRQYHGDIRLIWHELSFNTTGQYFLTRRNDGDSSFLQIWVTEFSLADASGNNHFLDYCTVDSKFPSLDSTHFFVTYRFVEEGYVTKRSNITKFVNINLNALISSVTFQSSDGKNIVTIPFRPLSLSESAYLSLAQIPGPPQISTLPVANISCFTLMFQRIRNLFHQNESKKKEEVQRDEWMSINFIKNSIGWPKLLPLTKEPNFAN